MTKTVLTVLLTAALSGCHALPEYGPQREESLYSNRYAPKQKQDLFGSGGCLGESAASCAVRRR